MIAVSLVIPCRNERGNIESAIRPHPADSAATRDHLRRGPSNDGTFDGIERVLDAYTDDRHQGAAQDGKGKGDAVRKGFAAPGDVLMILDADLTMPPESCRSSTRRSRGKGEFINGIAPGLSDGGRGDALPQSPRQQVFALLFTWLAQPAHHGHAVRHQGARAHATTSALARGRGYLRRFRPVRRLRPDLRRRQAQPEDRRDADPLPGRTYGETQISRFRHGWMLLRMVLFAYRKLKAI